MYTKNIWNIHQQCNLKIWNRKPEIFCSVDRWLVMLGETAIWICFHYSITTRLEYWVYKVAANEAVFITNVWYHHKWLFKNIKFFNKDIICFGLCQCIFSQGTNWQQIQYITTAVMWGEHHINGRVIGDSSDTAFHVTTIITTGYNPISTYSWENLQEKQPFHEAFSEYIKFGL